MKPPPRDWPRLSSAIVCLDAAAEIHWLCEAFGFEVRIKVEGEGGKIEHSELTYGGALVMVSEPDPDSERASKRRLNAPGALGGANTQALLLYVDDVDAHCARVKAMGGRVLEGPEDHDYGDEYWCDRGYSVVDPEGHVWWIAQRIREAPQR
jgi:uncharacterized glyoxalase superfamily protein PhnB